MKRCTVLILFLGLIAGKMATAQTVCAGAAGASPFCAQGCSGTVVNEESQPPNTGKFNVGGGNQGDGNDGFSNVGNFNIGSGNVGNCNLNSGGNGGTCDVSNDNGGMVLRFCNVYPTDGKCQPSGYLTEFTQALRSQIAAIVASCSGSSPTPTTPPPPTTPSSAPPSGAVPPAGPTPPSPTTPTPPAPATQGAIAPGSAMSGKMPKISDSKADFPTLLSLFAEHLKQEKAAGRKLRL